MIETQRLPGEGVTLAVLRRPVDVDQERRVLLLLHGWPGTRLDWVPVLNRLAADSAWQAVDLVVPDLRGFGESETPPEDPTSEAPYAAFTPAAHTRDLLALISNLAAEHVLIGGYDLGANLAQALARSSVLVEGLVLHDPVHSAARAQAASIDLSAELWYQQLHLQPWAGQLIGHDRHTVEIYLRHFYTHWWGRGTVDEEHFQHVVDNYARPGAFEASIAWYRSRAGQRAKESAVAAKAERLPTPARILWGEEDPVTPVMFAGSLDRSFESALVRRLPGVGHFGPLEAPDELHLAFTELARDLGWLKA